MFYFRGKRNRKTYFLVMVIVNFICMYLFELLNGIDRYVFRGNVPFIIEKSSLVLLSDILTGICLLGFVNVIWLLFCNKAKRAQDIGISLNWILFLEAIRYHYIFQSFLILPTINGDIMNPYPVLTIYYKFWVYGVPIILGFIPPNFKLSINFDIKNYLKLKRKKNKDSKETIEGKGVIETERE